MGNIHNLYCLLTADSVFKVNVLKKKNRTTIRVKTVVSRCEPTFCRASTVSNMLADKTSRGMRFPTMWYVRPAKAKISLRIRAV